MRLGAWLLSKGRITEDQLRKALEHQRFFGGRIGSSLITLGYVDEDVLGAYLSDVSGTPYAPAARLEVAPPEAIALVPARLAVQYRVVPIGVEGRRLRLAMRDPRDLIALDEIAFMTGMTIEPYVATDFRIQKALERYYQVTATTQTVPLAGPPPEIPVSPSAARTALPAAAPAVGGPRGAEVGLDGYPLDADPDQITSAFPAGASGVPLASGESDTAPPSSLEQWRMAQEEIPDRFPDPPARPAPRAGGARLAVVPKERPAPVATGIEEAADRLQRAANRDEVFETILDVASSRLRRVALFIVHPDRLTGWGGRGIGVDTARVRSVSVPLDRPSVFTFFRTGADHHEGPLDDQPVNSRFFIDMGMVAAQRAVLVPLVIRDRPTVLLYADNIAGPVDPADVPELKRLLAKASLALEILILRNKISTL